MPLISATRLRVRSVAYLPAFLWDTFKSARQAERSPGFLGGRLLVNTKYVFWTMTAWEDEFAMNAYRTGGAHRRSSGSAGLKLGMIELRLGQHEFVLAAEIGKLSAEQSGP